MSDLSEVSFSLLAAAKEYKVQGRAEKEGTNSNISFYLFPHSPHFRGGIVL